MTETKIYCDHCKKLLHNMTDYIDINIELAHIWRRHDLCSECLEKLKNLVDDFLTITEEKRIKDEKDF